MLNIGIILGSIRAGSLGETILDYWQKQTPNTADVTYHWLKLWDFPLEPYHHDETPLSQRIQGLQENESRWLETLAKMDGFVFVSPEYDHALTGAFKNALDYVGPETDHKPVQIVTYSSYSDGGMLSAANMVGILQMLQMIVLPTPVLLWNAGDNFAADGTLKDHPNSAHFANRLAEATHDITFYSQLLKDHPYEPINH